MDWADELKNKIFPKPGAPAPSYGRAKPGLPSYMGRAMGGPPRKFQKCKNKWCENPIRNAPGATRCIDHRLEENMGCAAHDKPDCPECGENVRP